MTGSGMSLEVMDVATADLGQGLGFPGPAPPPGSTVEPASGAWETSGGLEGSPGRTLTWMRASGEG